MLDLLLPIGIIPMMINKEEILIGRRPDWDMQFVLMFNKLKIENPHARDIIEQLWVPFRNTVENNRKHNSL